MQIEAVGRNDIAPCPMPQRFKTDIAYFMTPGGEAGVPPLASGEYWIDMTSAERWLAEGVVEVVSPLDSYHHTEFEVTEEQEAWLAWLVANRIQHVRVQE